jgi:hypothetical protein
VYREDHRTTATYSVSEVLTCQLRAVITVAHNTVLPLIIVVICCANAFVSQVFSAITTYKTMVVHALKETLVLTFVL